MDNFLGQPFTLVNKKFAGIVQNPVGESEFEDPKIRGRYLVHIPELMHHIEGYKGIWCSNGVHPWRITNSEVGEYGQYFPLHHDTHVLVEFHNNDVQSGMITRIISDYIDGSNVEAQDCTTPIEDTNDRDEQYILFKTPKKWNIFYVNEETQNEPNTIYLVYNRDGDGRRTTFRIDEDGLHFWTRNNNRVRIKLDDNKQVDGDQTEYVKGYRTKHVDGDDDSYVHMKKRMEVDVDLNEHIHGNKKVEVDLNEDHHTSGDLTISVDGNCQISAKGNIDVLGEGDVHVESGGTLHLNKKKPVAFKRGETPEPAKPETTVRDLGMGETSEYDQEDADVEERPVVVGKKADSSQPNSNKTTNTHNTEHRETLPGNVHPHHKPE